jgi:hypothetical protein
MTEQKNFIPALKYDRLTKLYDPILELTMPERKFKSALIDQMKIKPKARELDYDCGLFSRHRQTHEGKETH